MAPIQSSIDRDDKRSMIQPDPGDNRYRTLMIAPTSFFADYGCHVRILEEARVLQKRGHQVTIVTYHNGNDVAGVTISRTMSIPWRQHYEVGSSRHKLAFDALLGAKTLWLLARQRFDVIHAHLHEGALIGLVLGNLLRIPVVFDFQGSLTEEMIDHRFLHREGKFYGPLRRLETWINRRSPRILVSTANARHLLVDQFAVNPEQVVVVPDCVNADVFRPAAEHDAGALLNLRRQLGIPDGNKVIVYLGLLAEYQGTTLLLEAMQRILQQRTNVTLLLMGFPGIDTYREKARALFIDHAVIFTGRIPYQEAPTYLALGDVAAAPKLSLTEGAGKLLNYMAVGLPTVAFDTPVAREYLGAHGSFALRGESSSLAEKLDAALFDTEEARIAGARLRKRAIQSFDWTSASHLIETAYQCVTGKQPTGVTSTPHVQAQD